MASWRIVILPLSGSAAHDGTKRLAKSSGPMRPSSIASINDVPPTSALAKDAVPTLAGIKYTHGDLMDFLRCLRYETGRFDIMFGQDEQLLAALACGAAAAVGSTYGYAAPLYLRIIDAYHAGDMVAAQRSQLQSAELVALLIKYGPMGASKAMMKLAGIDCGPPRPPLRTLTAEQFDQLRSDLERVGFFTYCCCER